LPKPCTQLTAWQVPAAHWSSVFAGPVVHTSPLALSAWAQSPVEGVQVPAALHSVSGQVMGCWPTQAPERHTSTVVQRSLSLHAVLSAFAAATQVSVTTLQLGVWHCVTVTRPLQFFGAPPPQDPSAWHTSLTVQNFPSLQAPPSARGKQPSQQVLVPLQVHAEVVFEEADSGPKPRAFCAATVKP
jgi:hypothetical protein